jgi:autotransporter strand-loop-strand O-heptosyltransferase
MTAKVDNRIIVSFTDGPKVEVVGDKPADYHVQFVDANTGMVVYQSTIQPGHWSMANLKYLVDWHVIVRLGKDVAQYRADYREKKMFVDFGSKALGDNIAWIPYVDEFRKKYDAEVHVKTFWNSLFKKAYPELHFLDSHPGNLSTYYAAFTLGAFDGDYNRNKNHWRLIPLQQIASDILGLLPMEIRPKVVRSRKKRPIQQKYAAISEFSTFKSKLWLHQGGWQKVVDYLVGLGYKVMSISKERSNLKNVLKKNNQPIEETIRNLQHADLFIGVSSGTSVLAWALGIPVVLVSGFSLPDKEMRVGVERVINRAACHGCGNDISHAYDRGNWNMCPRNRNFECSTSITPEMVIEAVDKSLRFSGDMPRVMLLSPHCSTGGGPQYLLKSVEELQKSGHEVSVVEYHNLSDHYTVQKNKIKNLCNKFYTLNGDKRNSLSEIIGRERPDIIHVQEFPERWMDEDAAAELYRSDRSYRIVETSHSSIRMEKKYIPDSFAFVSPLHFQQYGELGIPSYSAEYPMETRERPDRSMALRKLGLDPKLKHILHVGLFAEWKNQKEIFEVARRLPQYQFHFVGNQAVNFKDYWEPLMKGKPDNCIVWGERDDVDDFYAAMDLFYFPSTTECNPIVLKEAMSWQMPVLMWNLPAYCGTYDGLPLVHFIDGNLENTCSVIRRIVGRMDIGLTEIYSELVRRA